MQKTGPRREVLFRIPVVYQFILVVTAAAAFGDSWTRSSGCAGGRAAASRIAPGCIVKALPIAIAEAFPVCLASGTGTDIMAAASAVTAAAGAYASAVAAAAGASTSAVTAAAGASASAVTAAAGASTSAVAAAASAVTAAAGTSASTVVTATTTSTITTVPSTSTKSNATHILHSPFLLVCTISYGTPRQSVSDCLYVFYCHPLFFFS